MRSRLRNERLKMNLTVQQVSQIIGLSRGAYTNIEISSRNPSWEVAQRLENFFGIPASELLAEGEEEPVVKSLI